MELITQIYLPEKKKYLDLFTDIPLSFTYSISDYNDISARKAGFSKPLTIPGTKNNNAILSNIFDLNTDDFNINQKVQCQVITNSSTVFQGVIRLLKCNNLGEEISYDIQLSDELTSFYDKLNDFGSIKNIDLSHYNHKYDKDAVITKSGNTYADVWVYPQLYNNNKYYTINDYKPAIFLKSYTDRLFSQLGYTVNCELFETAMYKHLIIPANTNSKLATNDFIDQTSFKAVITAATSTIEVNVIEGNYGYLNILPFNTDIEAAGGYDLNNLFNTTTYTYSANKLLQQQFILEFDVEMYLRVSSNCTYKGKYNGVEDNASIPLPWLNLASADIRATLTGKTINIGSGEIASRIQLPRSLSAGDTLIVKKRVSVDTSYNCNIGDKFFAGINAIYDNFSTTGYDYYHKDSDNSRIHMDTIMKINTTNSVFKNIPAESELTEGQVLNLNNFVPNITAKDLISNIIKMFNLYVELDKTNPNTLIIKTKDEFYKNGKIKDWTKKVDTTKTVVQSWLSETQPKTYSLTYKSGSDIYNKKYKLSSLEQTEYGSVKYVYDNEYLVGDGKFESIFSPTPTVLNAFKHIVPAIPSSDIGNSLRLLYLTPITSDKTWSLKTSTGTFTYNQYNCATHMDNPYSPTFDIHFAQPEFRFDGYNTVTENNLSSLYWDSTFKTLMSSKLVTLYLTLNEIDIENLNFSDQIFIDTNYYIINKIYDYSPNSIESTKVELIKYDPILTLKPNISQKKIDLVNIKNISPFYGVNDDFNNNTTKPNIKSWIIGEQNHLYSDYSAIIGESNEIYANTSNLVTGISNFSDSNFSKIIGTYNTLSGGSYNSIHGSNSTTINTNGSSIFGNLNSIESSDFSVINGYNNTIKSGSSNSTIFGNYNHISSSVTGSTIIGQGITATTNDTMYLQNLNINSIPPTDNTLTNILVRGADGSIKLRTVASISGASGGSGAIITGGTFNAGNLNLVNSSGVTVTVGIPNRIWTTGSTGNFSIKAINDTTTDSTGNYAVAEGVNTLASGEASHAEGANTVASGNTSHAEGGATTAYGYTSHAEGWATTASGTASHAEGAGTKALGNSSHAEGNSTTAGGDSAHAEGYLTIAAGNYSHAGGFNSIASGTSSFAYSTNSRANGNRSVVLGGQNITGNTDDTVYIPFLNIQSITTDNALANILVRDIDGSIKLRTVASISGASGGSGAIITGGTFNAGNLNLVNNTGNTVSVAIPDRIWTTGSTGNFSIKAINDSGLDATGNYSVAEGVNTLASGNTSHAEGSGTTALGTASHAEGWVTTAYGYSSHAEGTSTLASGSYSHAEGASNIASGLASHAEGGLTTAIGSYSHAEGNSNIASGFISHAEGYLTTAIGDYSHAGGNNSIASGTTSFIHSSNSRVTGARSAVLGGQNITGATADTVYVPNFVIKKVSSVPTSSADSIGEAGSITWDNTYFYWKTATGWLRVAGSTF